jgi:predicted transposase
MQRTIRIQIKPNPEMARVLTQTIEQYTWSFNAVCKYGWEHDLISGTELHKATYYDHRTITRLPAQLVCAARVKATEALKSVRARKRKKEVVSCPQSKFCAIRYDARSYIAILNDLQTRRVLMHLRKIKFLMIGKEFK